MSAVTQVQLSGDLVVAIASSNILLEGFVAVSAEIHAALLGRVGRARLVNGTIVETAPVVSFPLGAISDRQFFQALASSPYDVLTEQEALDAVQFGAIPPVMQAIVDALPEADRFPTQMLLSGATRFERANPLVSVFGASRGMDEQAIDQFWLFAQGL